MYTIKSGSSEFDDHEYPTMQGNVTEKPYMQYSYAPFILNCLSNCLILALIFNFCAYPTRIGNKYMQGVYRISYIACCVCIVNQK